MMTSPLLLLVMLATTLLTGGLAQPSGPGQAQTCPPRIAVSADDAAQAQAVVQDLVAAISTATAPGADASTVAAAEAGADGLMVSFDAPPGAPPQPLEDVGYWGLPSPTAANAPLTVGEPLELVGTPQADVLDQILLTTDVSNGPETRTTQFILVQEDGEWRVLAILPATLDPAGCYLPVITPPPDGAVVIEPPPGDGPPVVVDPPVIDVTQSQPDCPDGPAEVPPPVVAARELPPPTDAATLQVINVDGSGLTSLGTDGITPAWSPDGAKIAFISTGEDRFGAGNHIAVINADGSGHTQLTGDQDFEWIDSPTWSPDGTQIAFVKNVGHSHSELHVMAADPSAASKLLATGATGPPAWSPDGRQIAYVGFGELGANIWVVGVDGSAPAPVTDYSGDGADLHVEVRDPTWSPDGGRIAFTATLSRPDGQTTVSLSVVKSDGTGLEALTKWDPLSALCAPTAEQLAAPPSPETTAILGAATWSPDGARLAFASTAGLAVIGADGSDLTVSPMDGLSVIDPAWSPNGDRIAFIGASMSAPPDIYVVNPDGSDLTRLTETDGQEEWLTWSPDGRTLLFRGPSQADE